MGKKACTPFSDHCQVMNGIILQRARKFLRIAKIGCIRVYLTSRELSSVRKFHSDVTCSRHTANRGFFIIVLNFIGLELWYASLSTELTLNFFPSL
jgi:hypothetical protein